MTALPEEVEGAIAEGAELYSLKAPVRIEADETVKISYRDLVCVRKSTTNKESAAMLFVYVLLGDYAQNEHYLQQDSWLPVNRETLSRYIEGYPQLSYLEEAALVIKEE